MKLCIPINGGEGIDAEICGHFGSAPGFTLYDQKTRDCETIRNPKAEHEHGQCRPLELLKNRDVVAVICKGMGRNAVTAIEQAGIKVFLTAGGTVRDAIDDFLSGKLIKLDPEAGCRGHHGH